MKKKILNIMMMAIVAVAAISCYDEQEGNDFDTRLPNVEIVIPNITYSGSLGQVITIEPQVKTEIPENDLDYFWEVSGNRSNDFGREFYAPLVSDDEQGKTLTYTCKLDSNITSLNKSYKCRLRAHQKSTSRDFYSADNFTITIQGITGLMVLYSEGAGSDVGVLMADEFMPKASSLPGKPSVTNALYSAVNGSKLEGEGVSIYQGVPSYISTAYQDRCRILVHTDKTWTWLNRNDLSVYGDWNAIFYLQGDRKVNAGNPKGFSMVNSWAYAFDGDDVFIYQPSSQAQCLFPTYTPELVCTGHTFTFAPTACYVTSSGIQQLLYANSVDGDMMRKGFVGISNGGLQNIDMYTKLLDTGMDAVVFNPGDMKADLVKAKTDQRTHVVAVMKGDAGHESFAGKHFFVDLYTKAAPAGNSGMQDFPQLILGMDGLAEVSSAFAFDFGSTQNMYYYATRSAVYHYGLDGTMLAPSQKMCMTDGISINFNGEITMMKMFDTGNVKRHDTDEILLVATWDGSKSTLYALHLDTMTGNVAKLLRYDSSTVEGWAFGKINDVYIKGL
ncbi:MAG: PKD-like family lipoprotein [Prevotellaceae bacterium]|nr:PKD-like family lipoprotein [Prevotellaceae bacterium]